MADNTYEATRRIVYGDEGATFVPVCIKCGRYVKAAPTIKLYVEGPVVRDEPNAECKKCGPTQMLFEGCI